MSANPLAYPVQRFKQARHTHTQTPRRSLTRLIGESPAKDRDPPLQRKRLLERIGGRVLALGPRLGPVQPKALCRSTTCYTLFRLASCTCLRTWSKPLLVPLSATDPCPHTPVPSSFMAPYLYTQTLFSRTLRRAVSLSLSLSLSSLLFRPPLLCTLPVQTLLTLHSAHPCTAFLLRGTPSCSFAPGPGPGLGVSVFVRATWAPLRQWSGIPEQVVHSKSPALTHSACSFSFHPRVFWLAPTPSVLASFALSYQYLRFEFHSLPIHCLRCNARRRAKRIGPPYQRPRLYLDLPVANYTQRRDKNIGLGPGPQSHGRFDSPM